MVALKRLISLFAPCEMRPRTWPREMTVANFLQVLDRRIAEATDCGETTGIVVVLRSDGLLGANVGDSAAWLFTSDGKQELTRGAPRKPFLGSGATSDFVIRHSSVSFHPRAPPDRQKVHRGHQRERDPERADFTEAGHASVR